MRDYMELGPTPCGESCEQLGPTYNLGRAKAELITYLHQLQRLFPLATFQIKSFSHDFGTYKEVCVIFDDDDAEQVDLAYEIEAGFPEYWDNEARAELEQLIAKFGRGE